MFTKVLTIILYLIYQAIQGVSTSTVVNVSSSIIVDRLGKGNFTTVQKAIDSIPSNNKVWVLIHVKAGVYVEKVVIPEDKQCIFLKGEGRSKTVISYGDGGDVIKSTTFTMLAENFKASDITFKNTYNKGLRNNKNVTWAPAANIAADKVSFYRCGFVGLQDTLSDSQGRHYFESCYIEGAIDFIWGNGQSFYKKCILNVTTDQLGRKGFGAYITAQGRDSESDSSGFVFNSCTVVGTGPAFLGRAYRNHSTVLFFRTYMDNIITPQGWDAWLNTAHEDLIVYSEKNCIGPGANKSGRVKWEKNLSQAQWLYFLNIKQFINKDGWLQNQPGQLQIVYINNVSKI